MADSGQIHVRSYLCRYARVIKMTYRQGLHHKCKENFLTDMSN